MIRELIWGTLDEWIPSWQVIGNSSGDLAMAAYAVQNGGKDYMEEEALAPAA